MGSPFLSRRPPQKPFLTPHLVCHPPKLGFKDHALEPVLHREATTMRSPRWGVSEEGNPAGLSSCSGGLRPLVELCVEPEGLCGRSTGLAVPLRVTSLGFI